MVKRELSIVGVRVCSVSVIEVESLLVFIVDCPVGLVNSKGVVSGIVIDVKSEVDPLVTDWSIVVVRKVKVVSNDVCPIVLLLTSNKVDSVQVSGMTDVNVEDVSLLAVCSVFSSVLLVMGELLVLIVFSVLVTLDISVLCCASVLL